MKVFSFFLLLSLYAYSESKTNYDFSYQSRYFTDKIPNTETMNNALQGNFSHKYKNENFRFIGEVFFQADTSDSDRSYFYPKDFYGMYQNEAHYLKIGYQVFNWSSNEAFQPVDILNSRNQDSSIQNASRIGELALSWKFLFGENSSLETIYIPHFSKPIFTGSESSFGPGYDFNNPEILDERFGAETDHWVNQGALKFSSSLWGTDYSFMYVDHVDRQVPYLLLSLNGITPFYTYKEQISFSSQTIFDEWLFKTEYAFVNYDRDLTSNPIFSRKDHSILALGLERSINFSQHLMTLIFEAQKVYGLDDTYLRAIAFQNDAMIGLRYAFNDLNSSEIFFSVIGDLDTYSQFFYYAYYKQRFYENWNIETGVQLVDSVVEDQFTGIEIIDRSDHLFLNLKRYF